MRRHNLLGKLNLSKVFWIYFIAFLLVAFNFNAHAEGTKGNEKGKTEGKIDVKTEKSKEKEKEKGMTDKVSSKKGKDMIAVIETNLGTFKIKLYQEKTPLTVDNFVGLAEGTKEWTNPKGEKTKSKYFDGITFHRVIDGFMIQTGDPLGTGTGGPGYNFKDEFDKTLRFDKPGMVGMANPGRPDSNGSQFFITVKETNYLNNRHTIFGEVIDGMDIVTKISKVKTLPGDKPADPVVIKSVTIQR